MSRNFQLKKKPWGNELGGKVWPKFCFCFGVCFQFCLVSIYIGFFRFYVFVGFTNIFVGKACFSTKLINFKVTIQDLILDAIEGYLSVIYYERSLEANQKNFDYLTPFSYILRFSKKSFFGPKLTLIKNFFRLRQK